MFPDILYCGIEKSDAEIEIGVLNMGKLVLLSGPSCVGKGPLYAAWHRFYPDQAGRFSKLVLYNSRSPRPGETDGEDYHFRPREEIERLRDRPDFLVLDVRGDLQAADLGELERMIRSGDVFFEGNPFLVEAMLGALEEKDVEMLRIFLSPLSLEEFRYLQSRPVPVDLESFVTEVMRRKLLRRTRRQNGILSLKDLENIERRAGSAFREIRMFTLFDWIIANHDGEDSEHWNAFYYPIGDARLTLECFAALVDGREHPRAERWPANLFDDSKV